MLRVVRWQFIKILHVDVFMVHCNMNMDHGSWSMVHSWRLYLCFLSSREAITIVILRRFLTFCLKIIFMKARVFLVICTYHYYISFKHHLYVNFTPLAAIPLTPLLHHWMLDGRPTFHPLETFSYLKSHLDAFIIWRLHIRYLILPWIQLCETCKTRISALHAYILP